MTSSLPRPPSNTKARSNPTRTAARRYVSCPITDRGSEQHASGLSILPKGLREAAVPGCLSVCPDLHAERSRLGLQHDL